MRTTCQANHRTCAEQRVSCAWRASREGWVWERFFGLRYCKAVGSCSSSRLWTHQQGEQGLPLAFLLLISWGFFVGREIGIAAKLGRLPTADRHWQLRFSPSSACRWYLITIACCTSLWLFSNLPFPHICSATFPLLQECCICCCFQLSPNGLLGSSTLYLDQEGDAD